MTRCKDEVLATTRGHPGLRRGPFCSCRKDSKTKDCVLVTHYPRAKALGDVFSPTPFLLTAPKETVCQVSPGGEFLFVRAKRNQKRAGGRPRRDCKRQGRAFALSVLSPGPPFITGAQDRVMQRSISGVEVSRHTLRPLFARRSFGSRGTLPGPRNTPAASQRPV